MLKASENALIIFIKNPVLGKVKTRLAQTIGDKKALKVYHHLLTNTREVVKEIEGCDKFVYYNSYIPAKDEWKDDIFDKMQQKGADLGEKSINAFKDAFAEDYDSVIIVSPDCPKLRPIIIEGAFKNLKKKDCVIGPTEDGGYYLIGLNNMHEELFRDIPWSTEKVYPETINRLNELGLSYFEMPKLLDVDREEDLGNLKKLFIEYKPNNEELEL